jgi:hypothetical protein
VQNAEGAVRRVEVAHRYERRSCIVSRA